MMKYLLEKKGDHVVSYLLGEDQRVIEIRKDPFGEADMPGDIYKARIMNIASDINAAFVRYREGINAYLPLDTLGHAFFYHKSGSSAPCAGDELLVRIKKIPEGDKLVTVSAGISLAGNLAAVDAEHAAGGVSSRIEPGRAAKLKELSKALGDDRFGIIIRTAAAEAEDEMIIREAEKLKNRLGSLLERAPFAVCPSCLYKQPPAWLSRAEKWLSLGECEIVTDDLEIFAVLSETAGEYARAGAIRLYENRMQSMNACYRLERELERALSRKVWLDSGAFLVIDHTEAMTVIDVNSGKATGRVRGKHSEDAFMKLNREAAKEAAFQIRLRNLSGIIIIDFINMKEEASRTQLMRFLQQELDRDPVRSKVVDMTKLNLVEITRQRKEAPLLAAFRDRSREEDHDL